jgi:uncharacterized protein (UPF0264 family)
MKLLVSARSVEEALAAAAAGADFIDLKEPAAGALGALPLETVRVVVGALRARHPGRPVSATVGDFPANALAPVLERVQLTADCGVDYVKVGIAPGAHRLLEALGGCRLPGSAVVPVFMADAGVDESLLALALALPFPALMLDTADKLAGSLLDRLDEASLRAFIGRVRDRGRLSGLAGALRSHDLPRLQALGPDFAGFRSAVCQGVRSGTLDGGLVRQLRAALTADPRDTPPAATPGHTAADTPLSAAA